MTNGSLPSSDQQTVERQPVFDFDFYVDRRFDEAGGDLHLALSRLNDAAPGVFWSEAQGGYWVIRTRDLVYEAAHATDLFSSRAMNIPADDREFDAEPAIPIMLDPPRHAAYRRPLAELFGPQRMARMERSIREHTIELVEAVRGQGTCDFVKAVSELLPVLTFIDLIGLDRSRLREFRELAVKGSVDPDAAIKVEASKKVGQIISDFIDERMERQGGARENLADDLIALTIEGRPILAEEVKGYCRLLFFAGLDTVVNAVAFGMRYLATHPGAQQQMRERPQDIKLAVEELLRLGGPATLGRCVTRDEVWHGVHLRRHDRVLLELPAANLDPAAFPSPLAFNPYRENIAHLTFNSGPHRCVGQHLARIELRVMYEEWLARVPAFRLDPESPVRVHGGMVMGVDALPLVW